MKLKKENGFIVLVLLGIALKVFFILKQQEIWWDAIVYYGAGKYIFTLGREGLWEPLRPIVWPFFLGSIWKIGLPVFFIGKIITICLSFANVLIVYKIGKKIFDEKTAFLASFFVLFSFTNIFLENKLLTEVPAVFFSLLAFYFWINEKYSLSGFFAALSFSTKFTQGIVIIPLLLFSLRDLKKVFILLASFSFTLLPYFVFNFMIYNDAVLPLIQGSKVIDYSGNWMDKGIIYFIVELIKENIFFVFSFAGATFALISKEKKKLALASISFLLAIYFAQLTHKETRFFALFIPFLALISANGFYELIKRIKNISVERIIFILLIIVLLSSFSFQIVKYFEDDWKIDKELIEKYYNYRTDKNLFVTDPRFTLYNNNKLNLIYYPIFDERINELIETEFANATIAINTCDLTCATKKCSQQSKLWLEKFMRYKKSEIVKKDCKYYIFES